jgi:hypothetical protein
MFPDEMQVPAARGYNAGAFTLLPCCVDRRLLLPLPAFCEAAIREDGAHDR